MQNVITFEMRLVGDIVEAKGISVFRKRLDTFREVRVIRETEQKWCGCNLWFGNSL